MDPHSRREREGREGETKREEACGPAAATWTWTGWPSNAEERELEEVRATKARYERESTRRVMRNHRGRRGARHRGMEQMENRSPGCGMTSEDLKGWEGAVPRECQEE